MIDRHDIRITFYSKERITGYSQQVASPQDAESNNSWKRRFNEDTSSRFPRRKSPRLKAIRLISQAVGIYYLSADPLSLIYRVFRLSTFTTLMALAVRRKLRRPGCLWIFQETVCVREKESRIRRGFPSAYLVSVAIANFPRVKQM